MEAPVARLPLALHVEHSALPLVAIRVCLFSFYAFVITFLVDSKLVDPWRLSHTGTAMTAILSMVVGLMVSFRSESSTSRWKEAAHVWESVTARSRNLVRTLSLSLPINDYTDELTKERIEDILGLVVAFPVALRHHLRGERGVAQPDLDGLLPREYIQSLRRTPSSVRFAPHPIVTQIPSHDSSSSSMEMLPLPTPTVSPPNGRDQDPTTPNDRTDEKTKQEAMLNVPPTSDSARPASPIEFSSPFAPSRPSMPEKTPSGNAARRLSSALAPPAPSNLPLSILRLIHAHLDGLVAVGAMKDATRDRCLSAIEGLSDDLGKAEKIRDTPIPLPLSIHLHQMLSLFLLSIPPQLASTLGSWTIPVTGIATFCFLGVDSIGEKLADPFGVHATALPLASFTSQILQESLELGGPFASSYVTRLHRSRRLPSSPTNPTSDKAQGGAAVPAGTAAEEERLLAEWERRTERWMPFFPGGKRGNWRKGSIS